MKLTLTIRGENLSLNHAEYFLEKDLNCLLLFKTLKICYPLMGDDKSEWETGWISGKSQSNSAADLDLTPLHKHYVCLGQRKG